MQQKKSIGFGFRGWMLILYQAIAYITFQVFTQYPLNILADFYGGANKVSAIYSACAIAGIVVQIILVSFISKMKSIKAFGSILGAISLVLAFIVMTWFPGTLWTVAYALINVISVLYATLSLGLLVGQWFPTRKGTVMGIATLAFPIANGLLGPFATSVFTPIGIAGAMGQEINPFFIGGPIFNAFLPFFIVSVVGWIIGLIFVKDYPEQCGAYRDNDKSLTPEIATQIMLAEIENKKTSVWTYINTIKCKEFWFGTIAVGGLLSCAIGLMSQSMQIVNAGVGEEKYSAVMACVMIFGCIGSYIIGLIDTKIGTKKAMVISCVLMVIAGVLGLLGNGIVLWIAMIFVALFMGASSNFGVSLCAQYWRREDFGRVFALMSPIGSAISSASPVIIAGLLFGATGYKGHGGAFAFVLIFGIVALVLMLAFNPKSIKARDDKYREKAGKPLDDALVGRK